MQTWKWILLSTVLLTGCTRLAIPYQAPLEQGNVVEEQQYQSLQQGMSKSEVLDLLGEPILRPTQEDTWHYVYTHKRQGRTTKIYNLTLHFKADRLESYTETKRKETKGRTAKR